MPKNPKLTIWNKVRKKLTHTINKYKIQQWHQLLKHIKTCQYSHYRCCHTYMDSAGFPPLQLPVSSHTAKSTFHSSSSCADKQYCGRKHDGHVVLLLHTQNKCIACWDNLSAFNTWYFHSITQLSQHKSLHMPQKVVSSWKLYVSSG